METGSQNGVAKLESLYFKSGDGRYTVEAVVVIDGHDLSVTIGGGTAYHIGAAALAVPRPSLDDPGIISSSASVICVTGHKEDDLARSAALQLSSRFNCVASVNVGLHVDDATAEDIQQLIHNFNTLVKDIISRLADNPTA